MMESYGVIVEGPYEEGVYEEFIRRSVRRHAT